MKFFETGLQGVHIIELDPISDERGSFVRTYCKNEFTEIGFEESFVQCNQSYNKKKGTWRGLHYQVPPWEETKLIRCVSGRVLDFVVDLRKGSATYLKSFSVELSHKNMKMILIPGGFAHGFLTLEPDSVLLYQHTQYFEKSAERGLRYDDPLLNVKMNIELYGPIAVISDRDQSYEYLGKEFKGIEFKT
ncbi:MAG: dTDP-4-dehydrorhamnose 3,5-epimerase family protein [Bdellovibrionales bacterium]